MTTTDLYITDLSGGRSLSQHGGLFGPASDVAWVLLDFIAAGKADARSRDICNIDATVSGDVLIEILRDAQKKSGRPIVERDGSPTIACVDHDHRYRVEYIEF